MTHRNKIAIGKDAGGLPVISGRTARWAWLVLLVASACLWLQADAFAQTASQPLPVFFNGQADDDTQTLVEDPRLDGPAICQSIDDVASVCAVASVR